MAHQKRPRAQQFPDFGTEPSHHCVGRQVKPALNGPNRPRREVTIYKSDGLVRKWVQAPGRSARALYKLYGDQFNEGASRTRARIFFVHIEQGARFWEVTIWMELVEGVKLTENSLTVADAHDILSKTVENANWLGFHNDIKPDNFFITQEGIVKAFDFGHAIAQKGKPDQDIGDISYLSKPTRDKLVQARSFVENWDLLLLNVCLLHFGAGMPLEEIMPDGAFSHREETFTLSSDSFNELQADMAEFFQPESPLESVKRSLSFD